MNTTAPTYKQLITAITACKQPIVAQQPAYGGNETLEVRIHKSDLVRQLKAAAMSYSGVMDEAAPIYLCERSDGTYSLESTYE